MKINSSESKLNKQKKNKRETNNINTKFTCNINKTNQHINSHTHSHTYIIHVSITYYIIQKIYKHLK